MLTADTNVHFGTYLFAQCDSHFHKLTPEIMIPLVGEIKELKYVKDIVTATADEVIKNAGADLKYEVGTQQPVLR